MNNKKSNCIVPDIRYANEVPMFTINKTNIVNALVTVVLTGVLAVAVYIVGLGDIFKIDSHTLINIGVLSILNGVISLIKNFLTTEKGKFLGVAKVTTSK